MRPSPKTIKLLAAVLTILAYQEGKAFPVDAQLNKNSDQVTTSASDQDEINLKDLTVEVGYKGGAPSYSAPSRPSYSAPAAPRYEAPRYVAPAAPRYEAPRYTPPASPRYEAPRTVAPVVTHNEVRREAPVVQTPRVEQRHETPRIEQRPVTQSPVVQNRPSVPQVSQSSVQPESKKSGSGIGGWFHRDNSNSGSRTNVGASNNNSGSQAVRLDSKQGGIGGHYKNAELTGVKSMGGKTFEGQNANGERVRFHKGADGQDRITSVVKVDSSGREVKTKYDASGRKTSFEAHGQRGEVVTGRFHKDGSKTISTTHADGTRIISNSKRGGYVEKSVYSNGRQITQRTYVNRVTNRTYVRNYYHDSYGYRNYSPEWRFSSAFYTGFLLGSIWSTPYYYSYNSWGWYGNAWMFAPASPYAYYFTPCVDYADPVDWVTDYVIADTLAMSYEQQAQIDADQDAEADQLEDQQQQLSQDQAQLRSEVEELKNEIRNHKSENSETVRSELNEKSEKAVITKEIKAQISAQVRSELAAHQNETSVPLASVLSDMKYIFLVSEEINASFTTADGQEKECTLGEGDLFQLNKSVQPGETTAEIRVKAAKKTEDSCKSGTVLTVAVKTLEDIKSELAARAEAGAKAAQDHKLPGSQVGTATQRISQSESSQDVMQEMKQAEELARQGQN